MRPVVHGLEAEYWNEIDFVYLDRDDAANQETLDRYNFRYQPHFILISPDGEVVQQWFGIVEAEVFRAAFDAYLAEVDG
ncbi:MAG: thioredoxin family protein [Anaerolineae bacterium]|nr:thioredoxin family protein [Anaerolineae bacterium]